MNIYEITNELEQNLKSLGELLESGGEPSDEEVSLILGLEENFDKKVIGYHHVIKNYEATQAGLTKEINNLKQKHEFIGKKLSRLNDSIIDAMKKLGKEKAGNDIYSVKVVNNPWSVVIKDQEKIPSKFKVEEIKKTVRIDKNLLKKHRLDGIEGVEFVQKQRLNLS